MKHKKHTSQMIIVIFCVFLLVICALLAMPTDAYEGEPIYTDKQIALHEAAEILRCAGYADDSAVIRALSSAWWAEQENLDILAKVVANEADPQWCDWEHSLAVAVVVLNRVESPYFPNTVKEVVAAPGQYLPAYTRNFDKTPRLCYEVAKVALDGNHEIPSDVYWQDTHRQGKSVWKAFELDTGYFRSTTYICRGIPGVD